MPVALLALLGLAIAGYLTLDQLGVVRRVWEPFFGAGSERILHSWVSRLLPISDAALGALGYLGDAVFVLAGGDRRWRTAPALVIAFGCVALLFAATSVVLVILQPVVFHAWCTLCLTSAAISVVVARLALPELRASVEHVRRERSRGRPLRSALWRGA